MGTSLVEIPKSLVDSIREGNAILFLGSGASYGAAHPSNKKIPQAQELSDTLANKFLDASYVGKPLQIVSELAISERNLFEVQSFIADIFIQFLPADFHLIIPTFVWKTIATTNYDLIIEHAYRQCKDSSQDLSTCKRHGDRMETMFASRRNVLYLKLHGCINDINDENLPLILTPDQYITHKTGRSRLFERLKNSAVEFPILFVGTSLSDPDIRAILLEISEMKDSRPRSFMVGPDITDVESRFWENKKITSIRTTFCEFLQQLNNLVPEQTRKLSITLPQLSHPIEARFKTTSVVHLSQSLSELLINSVDYLHNAFQTTPTEPRAFYRGYFTSWDPILRNFDIRRDITDSLLSEIFLVDESLNGINQHFFILKGHAGSGKSVVLRRLAWEAAVQFDKICLFVRSGTIPSYYAIAEIYNNCKERLFVFIDPVSDNIEIIKNILLNSRKDNIPLTIISAERVNEWNDCCSSLQQFLTEEYHLKYLHDREIGSLISKLAQHKCLGFLDGLPYEKQLEAFQRIAGRVLLVALHEATQGKPFSEIILDEYNSIATDQAKSLYLTVAILHRLGVPARAGLISRAHGISFTQFKENLFKPLEFIVFASKDAKINDYIYQTRHPHISEILFEQVLVTPQLRFDEYIRVINCLDIDYQCDKIAFKSILNAKSLMSLFPDPQMVRQLFDYGSKRSIDDPVLMQQQAIFEMNSSSGNLNEATELLNKAQEKASWYKPISHSISELSLKKAEAAKTEIEKAKHLNQALQQINKLSGEELATSHPYHTRIKIHLIKLREALIENDPATTERILKDVETSIQIAKQLFPEDSYILDSESQFAKLIEDEPRAFETLKKAFIVNKRSPYIATRLSSYYENSGEFDKAESTLKEALEVNPADKDLNYRLSVLLLNNQNRNLNEARQYLRRAFTVGDNRLSAQFTYAWVSFLLNEFEEATKTFKLLRDARIDIEIKRKPFAHVVNTKGDLEVYQGTVTTIEHSFAFINMDATQAAVFIYRFHHHEFEWNQLSYGDRVAFNLAFTYRGPIAINVNIL